jgi:hypothetical protein
MLDVITLAVAEKYTRDSLVGLGALKGSPCTISKVEEVSDGTEVTFKWTGDDGSTNTRKIKVKDGISVVSASIGSGNHLLLTLSNDNVIDAGVLPTVDDSSTVKYTNPNKPSITNVKQGLDEALNNIVEDASDVSYTNSSFPTLDNVKKALDSALSSGAKLEQSLTVSNPIGSATNGKVYPKDTKIETVIRDMLIKEVAPSLTLAIVPSTTLYDVVDTVISAITMKATCTKNTYNLSKVEFYLDNVLKYTQNISASGTYQYDMTWATPTNTDFTLKAVVYDSKSGTPMSASKSITVKFVGKSYYGYVADDVGIPTENQVKALQNNVLKDTKNLKYSNITFNYNKVVYAYPSSFGNLSSIKDEIGNFDYTSSFSKQNLIIDSIPYTLYIQNDASASDSVELTFK